MIEVLLFVICLAALVKPVGMYLHFVYNGQMARQYRWVSRIESMAMRLIGAGNSESTGWKRYTRNVLSFLLASFIFSMTLLLLQHHLPWGENLAPISFDLALNISISFLTSTNLQTYIPEVELSMFSQNFVLVLLQFVAPAVDMAIAVALFRALSTSTTVIGNFWQDLLRSVLFILLPAAILFAIFNISQGVVQSFDSQIVTTLTGQVQEILGGPVASMQAISGLATNGGGYYTANAAHPFVTPTPLSNFVNTVMVLLLPMAFFYLYGIKINNRAHALTLILLISMCIAFFAYNNVVQEAKIPAALSELNIDASQGNMEGKEMRIGSTNSAVWASLVTATTLGAGTAAYSSFEPLSLFGMLLEMLFGEILFGGAGMGVITMLSLVIITVFLANLMIGRSPEYLNKKLSIFDIRLAVAMLVIPAVFLYFAISISVYLLEPVEFMQSKDIYGYNESLYAIISAAFNNGSSMGGINLNNPFYNILLAIGMANNSILPKIIACALAGSIGPKQKLVTNINSLKTHGLMFASLLLLVMILGALSYLPILILGPVASHMQGVM